ncbi:peroxiredoxin-like family protein [Reyranella sp.]|uniref:peroxiredoxin-like family protein n=1 Tax=Reyranella sp. TaxID=1929291 RepID=UPI003BAC3530
MSLSQTLLELSLRHRAALSARDRADFEDEMDRLRMLRVAEDGLAVGDYLPDFTLEDGEGRSWASGDLLDRGPLVLALFRGGWCPYCERTMVALEEARPAIEALGATAVGVMPGGRQTVAASAARHGVRYPLLRDPGNGFARTCGLAYEMSAGHIRLHRDRGRDLATLHEDKTWRLPVPAVFVVEPSARVAWAFSDVDPARWPDPQALLASLEALRDAHALSNR